MSGTYHHGGLRQAAISRTAQALASGGVPAVSLRGIAADLGVSHTAVRHHFGSLEGLFTAVACEGFTLLATAMDDATADDAPFTDAGGAYVRFALDHPGHFTVMFDADLVNNDDPRLIEAQRASFAAVRARAESASSAQTSEDEASAALAAWALVHGLVELHRSGVLERSPVRAALPEPDLPSLAARVASMLYGPPRTQHERDPTQVSSTQSRQFH